MNNAVKYLILFLMPCLLGCTDRSGSLERVDRAMENNPESALEELEGMNRAELESSELPYYGLLLTQARYKNYGDYASDSIFNIAYEAFSDSDIPDRFIRVHFLKAVLAFDNKEYASSMQDVLPAYEKARSVKDYYWTAKCAELIADIYFDVYNYDQSEIFVKKAEEAYRMAGKTINQRYSLTDLAAVYLNSGKEKEAILLLDSLETVVRDDIPVDSALLECISANRFSARLSLGEEPNTDGLEFTPNTPGMLLEQSEALVNVGDYARADSLLEAAENMARSEQELVRVKYGRYRRMMALHDYESAAVLADTLLRMQSDIAGKALKESVASVQSDFYKAEATSQQRKSTLYRYILATGLPLCCIIIVLLVGLFRMRMRTRRAELESLIATVASYRKAAEDNLNEAQRQSKEADRRKEMLEELFRDKWSTVNMLCNEYFERGDNEAARRSIINNIEAELAKLRSKSNLRKIEEAVDSYMGGIMQTLREECPGMKEEDYEFLMLVFAGLSARAVCMFTGIKYKYYYLKRSRLAKRLQESDASHRDLFLTKLKD